MHRHNCKTKITVTGVENAILPFPYRYHRRDQVAPSSSKSRPFCLISLSSVTLYLSSEPYLPGKQHKSRQSSDRKTITNRFGYLKVLKSDTCCFQAANERNKHTQKCRKFQKQVPKVGDMVITETNNSTQWSLGYTTPSGK